MLTVVLLTSHYHHSMVYYTVTTSYNTRRWLWSNQRLFPWL